MGYLSKVNFRVDSRRCPKAILPRSDPAAIRSRHDFEFLWKVFFFYSSSSSSCLTSSLFAAGSSRLKYLPVTYFCDCSVRAEELERGKKSDIFSKYITRRVIQRRLTLSMIGWYFEWFRKCWVQILTLFACSFFSICHVKTFYSAEIFSCRK